MKIISFFIIRIYYSGIIYSDQIRPITNSISNAGQLTDYSFQFKVSTTIMTSARVRIVFPNQFPPNLGLQSDQTLLCNNLCNQTNLIVDFYFHSSLIANSLYNLTIFNIYNPLTAGGVSNFIFQTYMSGMKIDENLTFGVIGISLQISPLAMGQVTFDQNGYNYAGQYSKYVFSFTTSDIIPQNSFLRLLFPVATYVIPSLPPCYSASIPGTLSCSYTPLRYWDAVDVWGINQLIPAGFTGSITISVTNPSSAQITQNFGIHFLKMGTNIILQSQTRINGVTIQAGLIQNITMIPIDPLITITMNKLIWFSINFKISNFLPLGSIIQLKFPATLLFQTTIVEQTPVYIYIQSGLNNISKTNQINININSDFQLLTISNYAPKINTDIISLIILLKTPNNAGQSSSIVISTLTTEIQGSLIDQDSSQTVINVIKVPSSQNFGCNLSNNLIQFSTYLIPSAVFYFMPYITVPPGGFIQVTFPIDLNIAGVSANSCLVQSSSVSVYSQSPYCFKNDRMITVQIIQAFYSGSTSFINFQNVIISPSISKSYLVDFITYDSDGITQIESFSVLVQFIPNQIQQSAVSPYSNNQNSISLTNIQVLPPIAIPSNSGSYFSVAISPAGTFSIQQDLGYKLPNLSQIPCNFFLVNNNQLTNLNAICQIKISQYPQIKVSNFGFIPANSLIQLSLGNLLNLNGPAQFELSFYFIDVGQIPRVICTTVKSVITTPPLSSVQQQDYSGNSQNTYYTVNTTTINQPFEIKITLNLITQISGGESIVVQLPNYGEGFCRIQISCFIQDRFYNCFCVPGSDSILIQLNTFNFIPASGTIIKITNIFWPSFVQTIMGSIYVNIILQNLNMDIQYIYPPLFSATPLNFTISILSLTSFQNEADVTFPFLFQIPINITSGCNLIIEFPLVYDLKSVTPIIRVLTPDFNVTTSLNIFQRKIQISGLPPIQFNQQWKIILRGVKSPIYGSIISGFNAYLFNINNQLMIQSLNFYQFTLGNLFQLQRFSLLNAAVSPINAGINGNYNFSLNLTRSLSSGTLIAINFPNQFQALNNPTSCQISNAINNYQSCYVLYKSIYISLNDDYILNLNNTIVNINIQGILNPPIGTTDQFIAQIIYSGLITGSTQDEIYLTFINSPLLLQILNIQSAPNNEGEPTQITIKILPSSPVISISQISVIFSLNYELINNQNIYCSNGNPPFQIQCYQTNGFLLISGLTPILATFSNPLIITISNIIVPNRVSDLGNVDYSIYVGHSYQNNPNQFLDFLATPAMISSSPPPQWITINNFSFQNQFCRLTSNIFLNVTVQNLAKSSLGGQIIIDLPNLFTINADSLQANSQTANFGSSLKAIVTQNKIQISGNPSDFSGTVVLNVLSVKNPIDYGQSSNFVIRILDFANNKITQRSYSNLDPFNFIFNYPGPLIIINNDKNIVLYRGLISQNIPIQIQNGAAFNLTLIGNLPNADFLPFSIPIVVGSTTASFQISVPIDYTLGNYTFQWILQGDSIPNVYTPIRLQTVSVFDIQTQQIDVKYYSQIPFGGISLPVVCSIQFQPDLDLYIILNTKVQYAGIQLSKNKLNFDQGTSVSFQILFTNNTAASLQAVTQVTVALDITGSNAPLFYLSTNSITFNILPANMKLANVLSFNLYSATKTTAVFSFSVDSPVILYYFVGLQGTPIPSFNNVLNRKNTNSKLLFSLFGQSTIFLENISNFQFSVKGLTAGRDYVIYIYPNGLNNQLANGLNFINFATTSLEKAADCSIKLNQSYLSPIERISIMQHIANLLSLPIQKILEKKQYQTNSSRLLQQLNSQLVSQQISILFYFYILPDPNTEIYPSPKTLGASLNSKIALLVARIPTLDPSYVIQSSDFVTTYPKFVQNPSILTYDFQSVTISVQLDSSGWAYAACIVQDVCKTDSIIFQLSLGLDCFNNQIPFASIQINIGYLLTNFTIFDLNPLNNYTLYVIGANSQPGYPELMNAQYLTKINFMTTQAPLADYFYLFSKKIVFSLFIVILFI